MGIAKRFDLRIEYLGIDVAAFGIDDAENAGVFVIPLRLRNGLRQGFRGQDSDDGFRCGQAQAARGGQAHAHAGEGAGADGHGDAIQRGILYAAFAHDAFDQRH